MQSKVCCLSPGHVPAIERFFISNNSSWGAYFPNYTVAASYVKILWNIRNCHGMAPYNNNI